MTKQQKIEAEIMQCKPLPAVLQISTLFITSIHPQPARQAHVAIQITDKLFHVFIQLT